MTQEVLKIQSSNIAQSSINQASEDLIFLMLSKIIIDRFVKYTFLYDVAEIYES